MTVIHNIRADQIPYSTVRMSNTTGLSSQQVETLKPDSFSATQEYVLRLSGETFDFAHLQDAKNNLNEIAKMYRSADQTIEKVNEYIEQMKAALNRIIKNFPPFPPGSEERIRMLMSFNSFRQLIDQLSLVPETDDNNSESTITGIDNPQQAVNGNIFLGRVNDRQGA